MNSCKEVSAQLPFYLDDELRGDEKESVESHLEDCAMCRKALARERNFLVSIREASPLYEVPPGLKARIEPILNQATTDDKSLYSAQDQLPQTKFAKRQTTKTQRYRWMYIAAASVIVFILTTVYVTRHKEILNNAIFQISQCWQSIPIYDI